MRKILSLRFLVFLGLLLIALLLFWEGRKYRMTPPGNVTYGGYVGGGEDEVYTYVNGKCVIR